MSNAIIAYNNALGGYLQHNVAESVGDRKSVDSLTQIQEENENTRDMLENQTTDEQCADFSITPADVRELTESLYRMKHMGEILKNTKTVAENAYMEIITTEEVIIVIDTKTSMKLFSTS